MSPYETPVPGEAALFAARISAHLPMIETARLRLRVPRLTDFDAWAEILCGPAGPDLGGPFERGDAFTEFAAACGIWLLRGHGIWAVESRAEGQILGFVLIGFEAGDLEPELGYLFRPLAEGQGFAIEAAKAARDHARALGLPSLVSYIAPQNTRSRRVAERLGAKRDGGVDGAEVWRHWTAPGRSSTGISKTSGGEQ